MWVEGRLGPRRIYVTTYSIVGKSGRGTCRGSQISRDPREIWPALMTRIKI